MTPEDAVKNAIMLKAGELGFICLRLNSGRAWNGQVKQTTNGVVVVGARPIALCPQGTSDLLVLDNHGHYFFIECKAGNGKPSKEQLDFLEAIKAHGGNGAVCWSVEDFLKCVNSI